MKVTNSSSKHWLWKKRLLFLSRISLKTLNFNFKYLPFYQAKHLPILIARKVSFRKLSGEVHLEGTPKFDRIRIGFGDVGIIDYKYNRTLWDVSGKIIFKGKAEIGYGASIAVGEEGELIFGKNFKLTARSSIVAFNSVVFGDDCQLSWDVMIMDTDLHPIKNSASQVINAPRPVQIGNHVWIGCRSMVLKGVNIPDNCIIGANSHVYKSLDKEHSVYAGNPIKQLIEGVTWEL